MVAYALEQVEFLSTPSARRATYSMDKNKMSMMISIHALCEEGDARAASIAVRASGFLSTPSARRATPPWCVPCSQRCISIHALCEEGDLVNVIFHRRAEISIHALCEEGDYNSFEAWAAANDFYPRPLRGGRRQNRASTTLSSVFLSTPSARRATK